jgi:DNA polymerase
MMTREDMMRELELLPVWKLRAPLTLPLANLLQAETPTSLVTDLPVTDIVQAPLYCTIESEDGSYMFVLSSAWPDAGADEKLLLRNIFNAMRLKVKTVSSPMLMTDVLLAATSKLLVAMGEAVTQDLLQSTEPLVSLRGIVHELKGMPMVVTFDVKHLLTELSDKPKAWEDLCLAMQKLQSLRNDLKAD